MSPVLKLIIGGRLATFTGKRQSPCTPEGGLQPESEDAAEEKPGLRKT
jgi:hypothetical protein